MQPTAEQLLLQAALQVMIAVAVPLLTGLAGTYLYKLNQTMRMKLTNEQITFVDGLVRQFVKAAEQYGLAGLASRVGQEKKAWVIARVTAELQARGILLDVALLADMVESAVLSEINRPPVTEG